MLWYTYLYENILFTNKQDTALFIERKDAWEASEEENRVALIKSFITNLACMALTAFPFLKRRGIEKSHLGRAN